MSIDPKVIAAQDRERVKSALKTDKMLSAEEVAKRLHLTPARVKPHLRALSDLGIVFMGQKPTSRPGVTVNGFMLKVLEPGSGT